MQISQIVLFQPPTIYHYLKTSLRTALEKAYPEKYFHLASIPITFSSITPDPLTDIATPYPLKISRALGLPVNLINQQILDHFQLCSDYLSNTADNIFYRGFFNFRLSDTFLLRSMYETAASDSAVTTTSDTYRPEIISKIELLLKTSQPENLLSLDQYLKIPLPRSTTEHQAARLIALSCNDGIHSVKTVDYFKRRLFDEAKNCYRMCPIQTNDYQLSGLRFLIIKALYIRFMLLTSISQA